MFLYAENAKQQTDQNPEENPPNAESVAQKT
jgi:hypothetical protein